MSLLASIWSFITFGASEPSMPPHLAGWDVLDVKSGPPARDAVPLMGRGPALDWSDDRAATFVQESFRIAGIIYRGGTLIADATAEAPLRVYDHIDGQAQELPNHPVRQLLIEPNPEQGEAEFMTTLVLVAFMNGFCYVEKVRSRSGEIVQLYPRTPDSLKKRKRQDGTVFYEQRLGSGTREIASDDVFAVPYQFDPDLKRIGITPVNVLGREIGIDVTMTRYLKSFLDESGIPPFVITSKDPIYDEAVKEQAQDLWQQNYGGGKSWSRPPILHGGWGIEKIGLDLNEMAFPDLRGVTELRIAQGLGIPAHLLGARDAITNGGLATTEMESAMSFFQQFTITNLRNRIDAALTRRVLREFEQDRRFDLAFDTSAVKSMQEDEDRKADRIRKDVSAALITREEGRQDRGYVPAATDGETYLMPFSLTEVVVGQAPEPAPPVPPTPAPKKAERVYRDLKTLSAGQLETRASIGDRNRKAQKKLTSLGGRVLRKFWKAQGERIAAIAKSDGAMAQRDLAGLLKLADRIQTKGEGSAAGSVNDPFYSAEHDLGWVLAEKTIAELEHVNWEEEAKALQKVMEQFYATAGEQAASDASAVLGVDLAWDITNPNISLTMSELGKRIVGISDTTRLDVAKVVADALTEGVDLDTLAARLTGMFTESYKNRSMTVGRTESQISYNTSSLVSYQQSGIVSDVELRDNPLHTDDPLPPTNTTCAERNNLIVPLTKGGDYIASSHPNCQLAVLASLTTAEG